MIRRLVIALWLTLLPCAAFSQSTNAATTNDSKVIATGNTFQTIVGAVGLPPAIRRSLTIQNNNTNTDNCWIFVGSGVATTANSILLAPGGSFQRYFPYVPSDLIQGTCATTGDTIYADRN